MGGLFQLNLYVYKEIIDNGEENESFHVPLPTSQIFHLENWGDYYKYLIGNYPIIEPLTNVFESLSELEEETSNHEE